jgi:hypothetical protein
LIELPRFLVAGFLFFQFVLLLTIWQQAKKGQAAQWEEITTQPALENDQPDYEDWKK